MCQKLEDILRRGLRRGVRRRAPALVERAFADDVDLGDVAEPRALRAEDRPVDPDVLLAARSRRRPNGPLDFIGIDLGRAGDGETLDRKSVV